jgi:DNA repair protein RadC
MPADPAPVPYGRVRELPESERPRERLARLGPQALTTAELLAILLNTGTAAEDVLQLATRLLHDRGGLRGLAASDLATLRTTRGVGAAKATTVAAAFELGRRIAIEGDDARPMILGPADIARLVQGEMELLPQEELRLLVLDTRHRLLSNRTLYRGSVSAAPARIAELFREAVRQNAAAIAVAHNHPSGDPSPSAADVAFTEDLVRAGALMQVDVLDHVVVGAGRFVSMRERRLGFER